MTLAAPVILRHARAHVCVPDGIALGPALERTDSVEGRLLRAGARECAGDGAGALSDLQRALDLSQSEPQRAAIRGYLSEARLRHPGAADP